MAGHSDVAMTLNIYTHSSIDSQQKAVDVISKILN